MHSIRGRSELSAREASTFSSGTTAGRIRSTSEAAGLLMATIDENSSGADDPAAINVAPATSSERLLQIRCVRS